MKIKNKNINKLIKDLSGREIDFYLYAVKRQSDIGYVEGITQLKMQEDIGMPRSTFHVVLNSLEEKGMIDVDWDNHNKYFCLYLTENKFLSMCDFKEGYVNINLDFILSKDFMVLGVNLKKFFLRLLGLQANRKEVKLLKDTLKRYKVLGFMEQLSELFDIETDGRCYWFKIKVTILKQSGNSKHLEYQQRLINYCRNYNIEYTLEQLRDTANVIINNIQKKLHLIHRGLDYIREKGVLQPKLLNYICSSY